MTQPVASFGFPVFKPLHLRPQIEQVQKWFRAYIGEGVRVNLEWFRTGAQTFELIGGDRSNWTMKSLYGDHGVFQASAPQSLLMIDEPRLEYTVKGNDIRWEGSFTQRNGVQQLSPCSGVVGGPQNAVGSIGLMGVVSILSFVWQLIHPQVSLTLPGDLGCQVMLIGEELTVEMLSPLPMVKVQVVVKLLAGVSKIIASPKRVVIEFSGSAMRRKELEVV